MKAFSFAKKYRILKRKDFLKLKKSGLNIYNRDFIALVKGNNSTIPRLGISVSKKVGKAVRRNKIKRCVRQYFRLNKEGLEGLDINIIPKKHLGKLQEKEFFSSLENIFQRVKKCKNKESKN